LTFKNFIEFKYANLFLDGMKRLLDESKDRLGICHFFAFLLAHFYCIIGQ